MSRSVYLWTLRPEAGLALELRITAESASVARRAVRRFLAEHDGGSWDVERVAREMHQIPHVLVLAARPHQRGMSAHE